MLILLKNISGTLTETITTEVVLTDSEHLDMYTIIQKYQTILGRNVKKKIFYIYL